MKITTERLPNCRVALTFEPSEAQVEDALRQAARKIARNYNVPGFRRGKAPYHAVVRAFGKEALYEQVVDDLADKLYRQALDESGIDPVAPGEFEEVTFDPLVFRMVVPVAPVVDLGDYRALRLERPAVEVGDEEVQGRLEDLRQSYSEWVPLEDEPSQFGDMVSLKIVGTAGEDDVILEEEDFELVLEPEGDDFPPGFDAQFVDRRAGDEVSFDLQYPEDWAGERAGITAHFEAEVLDVKRFDEPALDDDFASLIGEYDTLAELTDALREDLVSRRQIEADNDYANQVLEQFVERATTLEYPDAIVEQRIDYLVDEQKRELQRMGLPYEEFLRITRQTPDQVRAQLRETAESQVRADLVLDMLGELEHIQPTEEEIDEQVQNLLEGSGEESDSLQEMLASPSGRLAVAFDLTRRKTIERMTQIADGTAPALELPAQDEPEDSTPEEVTLTVEDEGDGESAAEAEADA